MRYVSVPERLGVFGLGVSVAALVYPRASRATGLGLPCPLRTCTGIPCPFCGMTTAAVELVAAHPAAAVAANPLILGLAALAAAAPVLLALRVFGLAGLPVAVSSLSRRRVWYVVGPLAVASWLYQLHRFGYY